MNRQEAINIVKKNWPDSSFTSLKEALEFLIPELMNTDDEKIKEAIIKGIIHAAEEGCFCADNYSVKECVAWLEKQGEQKPCMIQWKGDNLKEVIDFTGKDKNFEKWFKSFEEYEKYVHDHDGIFKLFNTDGSHYEVPVGAWIVKTPDGYNVASKAKYKQNLADKIEPKFKVGDTIYYNSFGEVKSMLVANVVTDSTDNPMYEDKEGNAVFEKDIIENVFVQ